MQHDIEIMTLGAEELESHLPALAAILHDCVTGGASVGFMQPFTLEEAGAYWRTVQRAVACGESILLVARLRDEVVGTVQLGLSTPPNQPHRADVKKLLVHGAARGKGVAGRLMAAVEAAAMQAGKRLLVLDTATGEPAEALYDHWGWHRAGVVPDYALFPDGRFCSTTIFYKTVDRFVESRKQ
ncbi:N-acetyltransferase family protein [Allorhizobium undicola]|uniref:GNAT family N-acetyltransferase n=1 Tax=Allorhizobium undicola TaxID=78527 RepID=UPI003D32AB58